MSWQAAVEKTVSGMGYELVECEKSSQGLLRVYIDRLSDAVYPTGPGEYILVEDCELVTRQLQYVLEVENCNYARLEVSSPGLDRLIKKPRDYVRFAGQEIELTLKMPFEGRKKYRGLLQLVEPSSDSAVASNESDESNPAWELVFSDGKVEKVLGFRLNEVREARLVPVVDFKGRRKTPAATEPNPIQESGDHKNES